MARIRSLASQVWTDPAVSVDAEVYYLYCISEKDGVNVGPCKIGIATHIEKRFSSLQGGNWRPLVMCWAIRVGTRKLALSAEAHCLMCLRPSIYGGWDIGERLRSEWVSASPAKALEYAAFRINAELDPNAGLVRYAG
jgi:hypothetical protein